MRIIVADASPLIALSKIARLSILNILFDEVVAPPVVLAELRLDEPRLGAKALADAVRLGNWLRTIEPKEQSPIAGLDAGETAAIHLAQELGCPLLLDERRGRATAIRQGVAVVGTGRILIAVKQHGLLDSVQSELETLKKVGYRLSDALCNRLIALANES